MVYGRFVGDEGKWVAVGVKVVQKCVIYCFFSTLNVVGGHTGHVGDGGGGVFCSLG